MPFSDYFQELVAAMALAKDGRLDEAIARAERGLELARDHGPGEHVATLARNAGVLRHQHGDLEAAIAHFCVALAASPDDLHTHAMLADLYEEVGNRERAQAHRDSFRELATMSGDPADLELLAAYEARVLKGRG